MKSPEISWLDQAMLSSSAGADGSARFVCTYKRAAGGELHPVGRHPLTGCDSRTASSFRSDPVHPASCRLPAFLLHTPEPFKRSPVAAHRSRPMRPASRCPRASPRQTPGSWRAAGPALFAREGTSRRVRVRRLLSASSAAGPARTFVRHSNPRDPIMITDPRITSASPLRHKRITAFLADKGPGQRHAAALHFTGCQHLKVSQLA